MKIQLDWLKDYVECSLPALELGNLLTMAGLEIEAYETVTLPDGRPTEILELNVTPNRGYCLSHLGVAREVAALTRKPLKLADPEPELERKSGGEEVHARLTVNVEEPELCPRYAALVIEGVQVGPSPSWLADRLTAIGLRPINNVVDITNFVLMEWGQPLHAFDLARLEGRRIIVRRARPGEPFTALDGTDLKLDPETLVIADAERAVALAGVMGGANSQVTEATTAVALESAFFDPVSIRKTSKKYGLRSDSSYRFERGVDIEAVLAAQSRAALLIQDLAGGQILKGRIDRYPKPRPPRRVAFRLQRCNQVLGTDLPAESALAYLQALGLETEASADETVQVTVPSFRPMLEREIDLIEEVARLHGYDRIESTAPRADLRPVRRGALQTTRAGARDRMRHLGFAEAVNYSFIEETHAQMFLPAFAPAGAESIPLDNPISSDLGTMRTSLLPGLVKTALRNINHGQKSLRLFEVGQAFYRLPGKAPVERDCLAALLTGPCPPSIWNPPGTAYDFFDIKGTLESLLAHFRLTPDFDPADKPYLLAGQALEARVAGQSLAVCGPLNPQTASLLGLSQAAQVLELDLEALARVLPGPVTFEPLPRFPGSYRDISILVDRPVSAQAVRDCIHAAGGPLLTRADLYDRYEGKNLEAGKKSLTFALTFQSAERTLTDEEVNTAFDRIVERLNRELGARLRD